MKILQIKGCWAANIGNAFLDLGSELQISKALPYLDFQSVGGHNTWAFDFFSKKLLKKSNPSNQLGLDQFVSEDTSVVLFTGMVLTAGFFARYRKFLSYLESKEKFILFLGAGLRDYNENEASIVKDALSEITNYQIISRDNKSFKKKKVS